MPILIPTSPKDANTWFKMPKPSPEDFWKLIDADNNEPAAQW